MVEHTCDFCGNKVKHTSVIDEARQGTMSKSSSKENLKLAYYILKASSIRFHPEEMELLGLACSDCYVKIENFMRRLQDGTE